MYDMMRRSIASSRSSPLGLINNRSSSFPSLSLFLSCLGNQTTTTTATNSKLINKSIYYSSSSSSWSQYHSRQHQSCGYGYAHACQNQRFMFKYYCCPTFSCARDTDEKGRNPIIEEEEAEDLEDQDKDEDREENLKHLYEIRRVDEETWDKVMSFFGSCSSIDSILESSDNWDLLLNSEVFMRLLTVKLPNCAERQELEHLGRYFQWALSRDDFRLPLVALCVTIYVFTMNDYQVGRNRVYWYLLWNYLLKRLRDRDRDSDIIVPARHLHKLLFAFTGISDNAVAIEILDHFEEFQCIPDYNYLWYNAFSMGHFFGGYKPHEPWESRLCQKLIDTLPTPNNDVDEDQKRCSESILMYLTIRRPELAHAVYIAHKDKTPRKTILIMIYKLSKGCGYWNAVSLALDMLADQVSSSDQEAPALFNCVICGFCRECDIEGAKKFMAEMILKGPPPRTKAFHDFIKLLCKNGDLEHALEMLTLMESRGLKPDVDTYHDIIRGYRRRGLVDQADKVFSMAKNKHPTCNDIRLAANFIELPLSRVRSIYTS